MTIYIVLTSWCRNRYFGAYTSILNARRAIANWIIEHADEIEKTEDSGNYLYNVTMNKKDYWFVITSDELDYDIKESE